MKNNFPISIWLAEDEPRFMHCVLCGYRLPPKVPGRPQTMLVGMDANNVEGDTKPMISPMEIYCKTRSNKYGDCTARYIIQGYIYPNKEEE